MGHNKISIDSWGLSAATKDGPFRVTRDRLEDLAGQSGLAISDFRAVYDTHRGNLGREADIMRRHGRADPTGVVTLGRIGTKPVFGRIGRT